MATQYAKRSFSLVVIGSLLLLSIFTITYAATTVGTNLSTTGTFTQTVDSATAARFQNAAGTLTVLQIDTTSTGVGRVGIGAAPSTTFEVQGTASASYFFTPNTIQVAGTTYASVAYSRFGTATTGHATDIDASNDLLLSGALEVNGTTFLDGKASVSSNFQMSGRFIADTAASHSLFGDVRVTKTVVVGSATASGSGAYIGEFIGATTGTASFYFGGGNSATRGTCLQLKSTTGAWIYMRFNQGATTPTLSTVRCH